MGTQAGFARCRYFPFVLLQVAPLAPPPPRYPFGGGRSRWVLFRRVSIAAVFRISGYPMGDYPMIPTAFSYCTGGFPGIVGVGRLRLSWAAGPVSVP